MMIFNTYNKTNLYNNNKIMNFYLFVIIFILSIFVSFLISPLKNLYPIYYTVNKNDYSNILISKLSPNYMQSKILFSSNDNYDTQAITTSYSYAKNKDIIMRQIDNDNTNQNYVTDMNNSALKLSGDQENLEYTYDAYGATKIAKQQIPEFNISNDINYRGQRFDDNTDLQYLHARFYDPNIRRFINQDSFLLSNHFNYGNLNPVMNQDPTGHFSFINTFMGTASIAMGGVFACLFKDRLGGTVMIASGITNFACGMIDNKVARIIANTQTAIAPIAVILLTAPEIPHTVGQVIQQTSRRTISDLCMFSFTMLSEAFGMIDTIQMINEAINSKLDDENYDSDWKNWAPAVGAYLGLFSDIIFTFLNCKWRSNFNEILGGKSVDKIFRDSEENDYQLIENENKTLKEELHKLKAEQYLNNFSQNRLPRERASTA